MDLKYIFSMNSENFFVIWHCDLHELVMLTIYCFHVQSIMLGALYTLTYSFTIASP